MKCERKNLFARSKVAIMRSSDNVHILHLPAPPLAAFLRVGHTGQQKLEALHAANRLTYRRAVFDAAYIQNQEDLRKLLKGSGCEIVLDLNFAEAATPGKFSSPAVSRLPWGNPERPWEPADFGPGRNADLIKLMAEFAVKTEVNVVLAPAHAEDEKGSSWHALDLSSCERLRSELDRAGGSQIAIDYQLITTASIMKDAEKLALATGAGTRHFIEAARALHDLGRPLVVDMAGGFSGLAAMAFGAVGGISHGVSQKESFDLGDWRKPPSGGGGGTGKRVYIQDLDRYLTEAQAEVFFATRGTKSRFGCTQTACCGNGIEDMIENGHAHFITRRTSQIEEITRIPETRRAEHFLLKQLDPAVRSSRQAAKSKFSEPGVQKLVEEAKTRLTRFRDALGALHDTDAGLITHSRPPSFRGGLNGPGSFGAVLGRNL
jgi:hypothetical protein